MLFFRLIPSLLFSRLPQLEDHRLSAVRDCLFNVSAATFQLKVIGSICSLRTFYALVTVDPRTVRCLWHAAGVAVIKIDVIFFMRKQNGAVCLGKRGVERLIMLKFVFKSGVIVGCISMSQGRSHMTAMKDRVIFETRFLTVF
jgi:hypothetical protein